MNNLSKMRPTRQTEIITLHLESFVNLRVQLEQLLGVINNLITKGESWIQVNDEIGTFSQVNQLLDLEMATCLIQLYDIAGEKGDDIPISQHLVQDIQERQLPSVKLKDTSAVSDHQICLNDAQSLREELPNLNKKISLLTTSVQSIKEKILTLNIKYEGLNMTSDLLTIMLSCIKDDQKAQNKLVESVSENLLAADAKYESRFAVIGTELQAASDFIQSQTETFAEKLETFEEKCSLQLDERFKIFEFKLKEMILNKQEESEREISEKISEIKIELNNQTKELDNLKHEKECLSSKLNVIQKTVSDIPMRIDTLEKEIKNIQPVNCAHGLLLVNQITDDNEKASVSSYSSVSTQTQVSKAKASVQCSALIVIGNFETQVAISGKSELEYCFRVCDKNPGHRMFIPIDLFTIDHLPKRHNSLDLYRVIKASADLTVRVDVRMTSPHRPEFWHKIQCSYPFYSLRNQSILRTGSGMVSGLYKFTAGLNQYGCKHVDKYTKCWCKQCQNSSSVSNVWWEIEVLTAPQVVFDDEEARHTSLRFFYDNKNCPVVKVDQVKVVAVNVDRDWCKLTFVTCDYSIGKKLNKHWKRYNELLGNVWDECKIYRDVDKITFIVSHPHGCSKHVSVGRWVDEYKISEDDKQFTYNSCTCPGSSGAKVHCVGYYASQLVHSGSLTSELNYSGVGYVE